MTGNVDLWPKPWTIVMNRSAFDRLTRNEQQVLLTAGRDALGGEAAQVTARHAGGSLESLRRPSFLRARRPLRSERALRSAVQPVYTRIERRLFTRRWIAEIEHLKAKAPPDVARCRTT